MEEQKIMQAIATFSAGYMKRWMEGNVYDKIFQTELGRKFVSLDKKLRYAIEVGLNLLNTFFDQKLAEDTALKKFVNEVAIDAAPELSKRLINTKEQLMKNAKSPEHKELLNVLLGLDQQTLIDLLDWLQGTEGAERKELLKKLSKLSLGEIISLAQLTPENKNKLFDVFKFPPSEKFSDKAAARLRAFNEQWEKWLEEKRIPGDKKK